MARTPNPMGSFLETGQLWEGSEVMVLKSFMDAKDRADTDRRRRCERRLSMFVDDWKGILEREIDRMFDRDNAREVRKLADISNNPFKRINGDLSTVYSEPPLWKFAEGVPGDAWAMLLRQVKAKVVLPQLNRITNACNEALLYMTPSPSGLSWSVVPPSDVKAWQDPAKPEQPISLMIRQGMVDSSDGVPCWHFWSAHPERPVFKVLDNKGRIISEGDNPYQTEDGRPVLPAVLYHRAYPMGTLWDPTSGDDLYEATLLIGLLETWINYLVKSDSIRQKYATGLLDVEQSQVGGPNSVLSFRSPDGTPVAVGEFTSQSDWSGLGGVIMRKLQNILNNNGLSLSDFQVQGDAASGFALRVRKEGLVELRAAQLPNFEVWDLQTYEVASAVWNFERLNAESAIAPAVQSQMPQVPWPSTAMPEIKYSEFQTTLTVQEKREAFELQKERIAMGLASPISVYMAEHPGATEDDAREAIARFKAETKEVSGLGVAPAQGPEATALVPPPGSAPTLAEALAQSVARAAARREEAAAGGGDEEG